MKNEKLVCPRCKSKNIKFLTYRMTTKGLKKLYKCRECKKEITV